MPTKPRLKKLKPGQRSGVEISHYLLETPSTGSVKRIHRVIAGKPVDFNPRENFSMRPIGVGGDKGTLELSVQPNGIRAGVFREVPEGHRDRGIGTDLLEAAERLAKRSGVSIITAATQNPAAERTYKKLGWKFVREDKGNGYRIYQKSLL